MKTFDITKSKGRVLIVSVYSHGYPYTPAVDYINHRVFKFAPKWATGFPTFYPDGVLKDADGITPLGKDGDSYKVAYIWTR